MISLSRAEARHWLCAYHFAPATLSAVFERLGSIQYDPLKPVGCNPDLVLQARVPDYRVDDWQSLAYGAERWIYDAWDKQASLVLLKDWAYRKIYHRRHYKYWEQRIFSSYSAEVQIILDELHRRGPLRSQEFDFQNRQSDWQGSWYGPHLTKNILKALWFTGRVLTAARYKGQHVYDLTERIVPAQFLNQSPIPDKVALKWLILARHQAVGLLRPTASTEVWSLGISAVERQRLIEELVQEEQLQVLQIEGQRYHVPSKLWHNTWEDSHLSQRVRFLAPLDPLLWDRQAVAHLFGFDYVWEVYKPLVQRRWGYYVLPVLYQDRFIARLDSRCQQGEWQILNWHWEAGVQQTQSLKRAIETAFERFCAYLQVKSMVSLKPIW